MTRGAGANDWESVEWGRGDRKGTGFRLFEPKAELGYRRRRREHRLGERRHRHRAESDGCRGWRREQGHGRGGEEAGRL